MTSTRYYSLDIIKILATVGIMFHHYQQIFHVEYSVINFYGGTFNCGYLVELFFLISGFLAYSSIMSRPKPLIRDFIHRAVRIYPMAMISCAIYLGIWLFYEDSFGKSIYLTEKHDFGNIIRSFLLIPQPIGQLALNNPTWYLAILIQCFILLEVCRYLWHRYSFLAKWLPVMVVILCTIAKLTHMPCEIFYAMYCRGIIPFFIGIIIYQLLQMKDKYSSIINLLFCILLLGTILAICIKPEWSIAHQQLLLMFGIYPTLVYYLLNMKQIINISYIYIYIYNLCKHGIV